MARLLRRLGAIGSRRRPPVRHARRPRGQKHRTSGHALPAPFPPPPRKRGPFGKGPHPPALPPGLPPEPPPLPPFPAETAAEKARLAEDAWNTRDPARVVLAYTSDSRWRNRAEFLEGRDAIKAFLTRKWQRELDYRLIKEV